MSKNSTLAGNRLPMLWSLGRAVFIVSPLQVVSSGTIGMAIAMVETGGSPGHAAARRTYEKAGFGLLPIARYFKKL